MLEAKDIENMWSLSDFREIEVVPCAARGLARLTTHHGNVVLIGVIEVDRFLDRRVKVWRPKWEEPHKMTLGEADDDFHNGAGDMIITLIDE